MFAAAVNAGLYGLAVIGVLLSAVGAYYYLRIIKIMYFDEAAQPFDVAPMAPRFVLGLAAVVLILGVLGAGAADFRRSGGGAVAVLSERASALRARELARRAL